MTMNKYCPCCGDEIVHPDRAILKTDGGEFNNEEYLVHPECDHGAEQPATNRG
jgi:hypothetical protein